MSRWRLWDSTSLLGRLLSQLGLVGSSFSGLLLLGVLREELLVLGNVLLVKSPSVGLGRLGDSLLAETSLSDESLDLGGLVEGLVASLDLASDNILSHIVLLVKSEGLSDVVSSLGAAHVGLVGVGAASDFLLTLLDDLEEDGANIGSDDAASDTASFALASSSGLVDGATYY